MHKSIQGNALASSSLNCPQRPRRSKPFTTRIAVRGGGSGGPSALRSRAPSRGAAPPTCTPRTRWRALPATWRALAVRRLLACTTEPYRTLRAYPAAPLAWPWSQRIGVGGLLSRGSGDNDGNGRPGLLRWKPRVPSIWTMVRAGRRSGRSPRDMDVKRIFRGPWLWIVVAVVGVLIALQYLAPNGGYEEVDTSKMSNYISDGSAKTVTFVDRDQTIRTVLDDGKKVTTSWVAGRQRDLVNAAERGVQKGSIEDYNVEVAKPSLLGQLLATFLPFVIIIVLFLFLMNQVQGGGGRVMQFAKSKAKLISKDMPKTTFADVAGCQEAIEELGEIKEFLQEPAKFQAVGAKIPKGVLLYGPPGTGKTLLARAVAGEAGVPFYSISGSDFVEMFVGVGASRVRDLFEQAKENAPAIIFIDEIDAVGRHRGAGMGGGHDEREQTLNQLLVEMDGFDVRGGVILIAATNRPDILDPALLRPGRFDRQIGVDAPDLNGRFQILKVHAEGKPMGEDVDLKGVAKRTVGMSGADLANVINEAAVVTARESGTLITGVALEESVDRVVGGPRRKSKIISEQEKKITAYHEGGHALAAWAMPDLEPVYKLTILPRGRTGGHALVVPEDDKGLMTRSEMIARLVFAMGGRSAEELVFHEPTTGASSDIDQATKIARAMVTEYGMSAKLGAVRYGREQGDPFLGRSMGNQADYSLEVAHEIDEEVRKLIEAAHNEAWEILRTYRDVLDDLVFELLEVETLTRKDLERIFDRVEKRPPITASNDFGGRTPSDKPPISTPAELAKERGEPWPPVTGRDPTPVGAYPGGNGTPPQPYPGGYPTGPQQSWGPTYPTQKSEKPKAVPHNYGAPP